MSSQLIALYTYNDDIDIESITLLDNSLALPSAEANQNEQNTQELDLYEWEKRHIIKALQDHQLNQSKAAESLGISRTTLWRRMKKYDINL